MLLLTLFTALLAGNVEVPLHHIWSNRIPGTRDIRELDDSVHEVHGVKHYPKTKLIANSLIQPHDESAKPGSALVVKGVSKAAFETLYEHAKNKLPIRLSADDSVSVVFYSMTSGKYCNIETVEIGDRIITVRYRQISHPTMELTCTYAIVPVGKLSAGRWKVDVVELSTLDTQGRSVRQHVRSRPIVCTDTEFQIEQVE